MNYSYYIVAAILCAGAAACTKESAHEPPAQQVESSRLEAEPMATLAPPTWHVSFYKLLAHAADYNGRRIQVWGVVSVRGGIAKLYPNLDSFRNSVLVDSIQLTFTEPLSSKVGNLDGEFVVVSGVFATVEAPHTTYHPLGMLNPVERLLWLSEGELRPAYDTRRHSNVAR